MINNYDYASMTQIGEYFGVSSHAIGRWLIQVGLRTKDKFPSHKAHASGFVEKAPNGRGEGWYYVWHREKTIQVLEAAGYPEKGNLEKRGNATVTTMVGPFSYQSYTDEGYEIVGDDGKVSAWIRGKGNAKALVALLNDAFDDGQFGGQSSRDLSA